ncbi:MAG TPA: hypothetical protein DCY13_22195 [Verrucomicrobiales bacterium]|nr:hypothetical protein [Verrucomicrobiales bacterium]
MTLRWRCLLALLAATPAAAHDVYLLVGTLESRQIVATNGQAAPPADWPAGGHISVQLSPDIHNGGPFAVYQLELDGLDLDGQQTPSPDDDVLAIRFRLGAPGGNGPHLLNVFGSVDGQRRHDDQDMTFDAAQSHVSGVWNNVDERFTGPGFSRLPVDSVRLDDATQDLVIARVHVEVTTAAYPDGALRAQLLGSPATVSLVRLVTGETQLTLVSSSPREIAVAWTDDWQGWQPWTNLSAASEVVRLVDRDTPAEPLRFYRITETATTPPRIVVQPQDRTVASGQSVTFSPTATGTAPLTPQWSHEGQPIPDGDSLTLVLHDVNLSQAGQYQLIVTNLVGSVASQVVTLTVEP